MNAPMGQLPLPQFRSHKVVGAAKIVEIWDGDKVDLGQYGIVTVGADWIAEKRAVKGGYFVAYQDGYTSYSPAKAFEEGNTAIVAPADAYRQVYGAATPPTPAQCLLEARNLLGNREMMFNEGTARRLLDGLVRGIESSKCFAKALANGEEVFVLRSIDMAAPDAIQAWAALAMQEGASKRRNRYCRTLVGASQQDVANLT